MKYVTYEAANGLIHILNKSTRAAILELSPSEARELSTKLDQSAIHILRDQGHLPQKPEKA